MKLVLISDSHDNPDAIELVRNAYPDADYLIHCGDSEVGRRWLEGYIAVMGNMDWYGDLPFEEELVIDGLRILIKHGHDITSGSFPDYRELARYAKKNGYDVICFGHTHVYCDQVIDGICLLNPGSVWRNRDGSPACYMVAEIENGEIRAERKQLIDLFAER